MNWHDWTDEAFTRARELERPVVLFVEASWCRWCRQLDREVLQDERIAKLLDERFVAIRVDKDRRPDLEVRYSAGGWPTLAYLDDTGEILGTDNYVEVDALLDRLELVSTYYAEKRGEIQATIAGLKTESAEAENAPAKPRRRGEAPELSLDIVDHVAATIVRTADPVHGGWGERHKFPHPEAIDFALVRWSQTGDSEMLDLVRRTLRQMQKGAIWDDIDGGFYRYATAADWSAPHYEKMLDSNAQRLQAYLEAYQVLGDDAFRRTAEGCLRFLEETMLDPELGVFRGSQDADPVYANKRTR
ncbi:MAG: DUF255 domain-containing protein, partial [Planctomycetota bacterium]